MRKAFTLAFLTLMLLMSNHVYLNDEMLVVLQVESVERGFSVEVEKLKSYIGTPWFELNGNKYAPFSYLLPILAYPIYKLLLFFSNFGYPDLLLALIAPAGFLILSLEYKKYRIFSLAFFLACILLFKPIYLFEDWAAVYALKLVNVLATSMTAEILFRILREEVDEKVALSASFLFVFATPVAYWTLSAKIHAISLLIIASSFYFFRRYLKSDRTRDLLLSSLLAGFCFFARALDGLIVCISILLFLLMLKRDRILYAFLGIFAGYIPCALFSYALFSLPLPVEIIGNRFSNVSYIEASSLTETLSILPFVFFGMEKSTLGMLSYSPVLASLIPLVIKAIRERKLLMSDFEKLLIIFAAACLLIYLPYLKHGIIETNNLPDEEF